MTNERKFSHGFTLVELLVVIAIIMLLVAMVLPLMRSARDMAKTVTCQANLRQMGLAVSMYSNDHRGYFPQPERRGNYWLGRWSHWAMDIQPYIDKLGEREGYKTNTIMTCPADNDTYRNSWSYNSYAYNGALDRWVGEWQGTFPIVFPQEVRGSVALITDGYADFTIYSKDRVYYRHGTIRIDNYEKNNRKGGTCNVMFGDFRVENLALVPIEMRYWE